MPTLEQITIYPVKSTAGINLQSSNAFREGLEYDRRWAIVNRNREIITAREYPKLLGIRVSLVGGQPVLILPSGQHIAIPAATPAALPAAATLFGLPVTGTPVQNEVNSFLTAYLGISCSLIFMNHGSGRMMLAKHGAQPADQVSYADTAPILLISQESLLDLNNRLSLPFQMKNFRPNLVISGCGPNEEDDWHLIKIGGKLFEVAEPCKRCVFTAIDPETYEKNEDQEPLRTLATYKRHPRGGVRFGINLIPRDTGRISCGDVIERIE